MWFFSSSLPGPYWQHAFHRGCDASLSSAWDWTERASVLQIPLCFAFPTIWLGMAPSIGRTASLRRACGKQSRWGCILNSTIGSQFSFIQVTPNLCTWVKWLNFHHWCLYDSTWTGAAISTVPPSPYLLQKILGSLHHLKAFCPRTCPSNPAKTADYWGPWDKFRQVNSSWPVPSHCSVLLASQVASYFFFSLLLLKLVFSF